MKDKQILVVLSLLLACLLVVNYLPRAQAQSYNLCQAYSEEKVSRSDFKALLEGMNNGRCREVWNVEPTFSLTKDNVRQLAQDLGITAQGDPLVFFRENGPSTMGIGALLVYGHNQSRFVIEEGDRLHIWLGGNPKTDIVLEQSVAGCNPHDGECDRACSYEEGVFDPACYRDNKKENVPCDFDAVDQNTKDGEITNDDLDDICDLDCYDNKTSLRGAYDPDCIPVDRKDGMIDDDSLGHRDGRCDPDAAEHDFRCDPDCNGTFYPGNPHGLEDGACYVCDKECNGYCSPACKDLNYPLVDPDCMRQEFDDEWCQGDEICDSARGENCRNSSDCPEGNRECSDLDGDKICCPEARESNRYGCTERKELEEGKRCACGNQCTNDLNCNPTTFEFGDFSQGCCPEQKLWDGDDCVDQCQAEPGPYERFACAINPLTYNRGLDICEPDPPMLSKINTWILSNNNLREEVYNGNYDNAVRKIWQKSYSDIYSQRYCFPACTGGSKRASELITGAASCGVCNHWAAVGLSLIRTLGVPPDRVYTIGFATAGMGHATALYQSDSGEWWVLDYTCCEKLVKASDWDSVCGLCSCRSPFTAENDHHSDSWNSGKFGGIC